MPMQRDRYPRDWPAISLRVRERDGQRCKFCGAKRGDVMLVAPDGSRSVARQAAGDPNERPAPGFRLIRIWLTVAHLGVAHADGTPGDVHDKMDCRDENLAALCQSCHLNYDRKEHAHNAAATRRRRRVERGQMELVPDA